MGKFSDVQTGIVQDFGIGGKRFGFLTWNGQSVFFHKEDARVPIIVDRETVWVKRYVRDPQRGEQLCFILDESDTRGIRAKCWILAIQPPHVLIPHMPVSPSRVVLGKIVNFNTTQGFGFAAVPSEGDFHIHVDRLLIPYLYAGNIVWAPIPRALSWVNPQPGEEIFLMKDPTRIQGVALWWVPATEQASLEYALRRI